MAKRILWTLLVVFAIIIGLYPVIYFVIDKKFGLLSSKGDELLNSALWNSAFYIHIVLGGLALLIGWTQFSAQWRTRKPGVHRLVGKMYVIACLFSAASGLYIAFYATGGIIAIAGFSCLGVIWFFTTSMAYDAIKKGRVTIHQKWMIYSYAACFAAVTLRIWLPLLAMALHGFIPAYRIVAWLCWVPNIFVAFLIARKKTLYQSATEAA